MFLRMDILPGHEEQIERVDSLVKQTVSGAVSKRTPNQLIFNLPLKETPSFSRKLL